MFHSHVDEVSDTNAGLLGGIIVTRANMATKKRVPTDVDKEFVLYLFLVVVILVIL